MLEEKLFVFSCRGVVVGGRQHEKSWFIYPWHRINGWTSREKINFQWNFNYWSGQLSWLLRLRCQTHRLIYFPCLGTNAGMRKREVTVCHHHHQRQQTLLVLSPSRSQIKHISYDTTPDTPREERRKEIKYDFQTPSWAPRTFHFVLHALSRLASPNKPEAATTSRNHSKDFYEMFLSPWQTTHVATRQRIGWNLYHNFYW